MKHQRFLRIAGLPLLLAVAILLMVTGQQPTLTQGEPPCLSAATPIPHLDHPNLLLVLQIVTSKEDIFTTFTEIFSGITQDCTKCEMTPDDVTTVTFDPILKTGRALKR